MVYVYLLAKKGAHKSLYIRSIQTHIILQSITYLFLQILFLIFRISECGWSLPSTPYHQPGALPLPKVLEVLDIILSVHIPIAPNSHTGSPWIWMLYATGVSTITLISIQNDMTLLCQASLGEETNPYLLYFNKGNETKYFTYNDIS